MSERGGLLLALPPASVFGLPGRTSRAPAGACVETLLVWVGRPPSWAGNQASQVWGVGQAAGAS